MGIFKAIMNGIGLRQDDEQEIKNEKTNSNVEPIKNKNEQINNTKQMSISNLVCYAPKSNGDVKLLIDYLKKGEPCIVNLNNLSEQDIKSVLDYLGGAIYALSGMISRLDGQLYVLSPKDVTITTM